MTQRDPAPSRSPAGILPLPPPAQGASWGEQAPWTDGPGFQTPSAPDRLAVHSGQVTPFLTAATRLQNRMKNLDLSRSFRGLAKLVSQTQSTCTFRMAHSRDCLSIPKLGAVPQTWGGAMNAPQGRGRRITSSGCVVQFTGGTCI